MSGNLFKANELLLLGIDIQEKLLPVMKYRDFVLENSAKLLKVAKEFHIQSLISEQYPKGLGKTAQSLDLEQYLQDENFKCLEKTSFSLFNDENISSFIRQSGKKILVVFGVETHVCVLQSVLQALNLDYEVWLIEDALSSRTKQNHKNALALMRDFGAKIINTESFIFGLISDSKDEKFKFISSLIK